MDYSTLFSSQNGISVANIATLILPKFHSYFEVCRDYLTSLTLPHGGLAAFATLLIYIITVGIYRLYFSPYARYPGPSLAGLTTAYSFYYDVVKSGQYMSKIQELHAKYNSPVIRINPNELHVNDPSFYEVLYAGTQHERETGTMFGDMFGSNETFPAIQSHDQHRLRRSAYNSYFSPASVRKREPIIHDKISRLLGVFQRYRQEKAPVPINLAFGALTSDVVTDFCFGTDENYTETPNFDNLIMQAFYSTNGLGDVFHITTHMPWIVFTLRRVPEFLIQTVVGSGMKKMKGVKQHVLGTIDQYLEALKSGQVTSSQEQTIFGTILDGSGNHGLAKQIKKEKLVDIAWQDAQTFLLAGTVTTATTISSGLVYLLLHPDKLRNLVMELEDAVPDVSAIRLAKLEQLPYLTASIQEIHRLVAEVTVRSARSAIKESLHVGDWIIPPKTVISMHIPPILHSAELFPSPTTCIPERWLPNSLLKKYPRPAHIPAGNPKFLIHFSRGARNCIGQTLANAQLYLLLAMFLRTFARLEKDRSGQVVIKGIRLWKTDRRDVDLVRDMLLGRPEKGRGNARVILE